MERSERQFCSTLVRNSGSQSSGCSPEPTGGDLAYGGPKLGSGYQDLEAGPDCSAVHATWRPRKAAGWIQQFRATKEPFKGLLSRNHRSVF